MDTSENPRKRKGLSEDSEEGLFKDSSDPEGLSKDPYGTHLPKNKISYHYATQETDRYRHLIIGHSQIRDKWNVYLDGTDLNFNMDWISMSGGKARTLADEIIRILQTYEGDQPLRISAIIWQNSVEKSSIEDLKSIVRDIDNELQYHPQHKVAFPTLMYIPSQENVWDKIATFNDYLREINIRNGLNPYNLHKTTTRPGKNGKIKAVQSAYEEYQTGKGKGYHIASHYNGKYAKSIRVYHKTGFRDHQESKDDHIPNPIKAKPLTPSNKMKRPEDYDMRAKLNDIKSVSKKAENIKKRELEKQTESNIKTAKEQMERTETMLQENKAKKRILLDMNKRLKDWEEQGREKEDSLMQAEKDLEARERELEMREAEIKRREEENKVKFEKFKASDMKLKVAIAENELEVAKLEMDRRRRKKLEKKRLQHERAKSKNKTKKKKN